MLLINFIPYSLLLFATLFIPKINRKSYIWILAFIFICFSGFRYGVGWDYFNYMEVVEIGGWRLDRTEFLMRQVILLAQKMNSPQLFFFITAFFTFIFYFITIAKKSLSPDISILFLLCIPLFFLTSLTTIRYSLSVATLFFAYLFLKKNNLVYLALLFVAYLIHRASIIGILAIPFLYGVKVNVKINFLIFVFCFILGVYFETSGYFLSIFKSNLFINDFMSESASMAISYVENSTGKGFSRSPYLFAIINLCNLFGYKSLTKDDKTGDAKKFITLFNLGCSLMFLLAFDQTFASRIAQVFMVYIILLAPYYKKTPKLKVFIYVILIFIFFFQLSVIGSHHHFVGRRNCFLPYRLFFFQ